MLENLAHVEFDTRPQRMIVAVTSPAIAVLPGLGLALGVLVGARSPAGIDHLSGAAKRAGITWGVRSQHGDSNFYPTCISLIAETINDLTAFAASERLDCAEIPAAWSILHCALVFKRLYRAAPAGIPNEPELGSGRLRSRLAILSEESSTRDCSAQ